MKKIFKFAVVLVALAALAVSCASSGGSSGGASSGGDTKITLKASDAELVTSKDLKMENGNSNIGWWSDLGDQAKWTLEVAEAGTYEVQVKYAVASEFAGAVVNVTVGETVIEWEVASTGDWGSYKTAVVGTVDLEAGTYPVMLQAKTIKNRFVANIERIRFVK